MSLFHGVFINGESTYGFIDSIVSFLIDLCTLSILWIGGYEAVAGRMNIGDVMVCTNYMAKIMMSMLMASHILLTLVKPMLR